MLKEQAKRLQSDFIPDGKRLSREEVLKLEFRKTTADEVYQCCLSTQYDMQSGPIFCGRVAEWIAITEGGFIALCGNRPGHTPESIKRG